MTEFAFGPSFFEIIFSDIQLNRICAVSTTSLNTYPSNYRTQRQTVSQCGRLRMRALIRDYRSRQTKESRNCLAYSATLTACQFVILRGLAYWPRLPSETS